MIQVYKVHNGRTHLDDNSPIAEVTYQSEVKALSLQHKNVIAVEYYSGYLIVDFWNDGKCVVSMRNVDADTVKTIVKTTLM